MAVNSIDRTGATDLIPAPVSAEIIAGVPEASAVMRLATRLPNMTAATLKMPVLNSLITAGFVSGDTGQKPTSKVDWTNAVITAEELAVIVPIPENVLDDSTYDIWGQIRPRIAEAFAAAFDAAVLFGTNKPASWPTGLVAQAVAASNSVDQSNDANTDIYDEVLGVGGTISLVEADGYFVNGHVAAISMRAALRGLRDDSGNGQPIFMRSMQEGGGYELDGSPIYFPRTGFDAATALLVSGDWTNLVYAIRTDITYKLLDQAVIQDTDGSIAYNLAQQDMVALRAVMRLGWQVANPINRVNSAASRFPFAVLVP